MLKIAAFFLVLTVIISPWRNSSSQDDAAYAYSAVSLAYGSGDLHAGSVAMNFPQLGVGVLALKMFSGLPRLSVLNFLTWIFFVLGVLIFHHFRKGDWILTASFFAFPIWIQYGACFHGEIYSAILFILLMALILQYKVVRSSCLYLALAFGLSFCLGSQLQNMGAFPFFWGGFLLFEARTDLKKLGMALMAGSLGAVLLFMLMPKLPYQQGYAYWLSQLWTDKGGRLPIDFLIHFIQLGMAMGLYLFPFLSLKNRSKFSIMVSLAIQALLVLAILRSGISTLSAGVLFIDYLPKPLGVFLISMGVWGWWGIGPQFKKLKMDNDVLPLKGTLVALVIVWAFSTSRMALDLRYVMTWALPLILHFRKSLMGQNNLLGQKPSYLMLVLMVSVVSNLYLLNTTDARWKVARQLESKKVNPKEISAGYGRNAYVIGSECIYKTLNKLERVGQQSIPMWKRPEFNERIIKQYGRNYADGWIPRFIVKPSQIFGKSLNLKKNRLPGQEAGPIKLVNYRVMGMPCQLAVYENKNPKKAWCDEQLRASL